MERQLKEEIKKAGYEEAVRMLNDHIASHPDDDEAYTLRGMRHWGAGKRSLAINDYLSAFRINPEGMGAQALKSANEILDFRNNDMFNP